MMPDVSYTREVLLTNPESACTKHSANQPSRHPSS